MRENVNVQSRNKDVCNNEKREDFSRSRIKEKDRREYVTLSFGVREFCSLAYIRLFCDIFKHRYAVDFLCKVGTCSLASDRSSQSLPANSFMQLSRLRQRPD